jgi:hypothetical protein
MAQNSFKLAAYLDQISLDPFDSISVLAKNNIEYAVLRTAWSNNILNTDPSILKGIKENLERHNIKVCLIASDIGYIQAEHLIGQQSKIAEAINLAKYFNCSHLRIGIGNQSVDVTATKVHQAWMKIVNDTCFKANIVPCIEISYKAIASSAVEISSILNNYKSWKIIYDPAILIHTKKIDPYVRYWSLLKNKISHIDIRDHKIGKSDVYPGYGDAKLDLTLSDYFLSNHKGYLCLEHGMGRRSGDTLGADKIFHESLAAFNKLLKNIGEKNGDNYVE